MKEKDFWKPFIILAKKSWILLVQDIWRSEIKEAFLILLFTEHYVKESKSCELSFREQIRTNINKKFFLKNVVYRMINVTSFLSPLRKNKTSAWVVDFGGFVLKI